MGVADYHIETAISFSSSGPTTAAPLQAYSTWPEFRVLWEKAEAFRIKVMEKSAYSWGGYDRPSSGAEVIVGNETYQTGSDRYERDHPEL